MDQYLPVSVHEEYAQRMHDEHKRLDQRIRELEENAKQITELVIAMHDITTSLKTVDDKLTKVDSQLTELKELPAKRWDKLVGGIIGAVASAIGCGLIAAVASYL